METWFILLGVLLPLAPLLPATAEPPAEGDDDTAVPPPGAGSEP